MKNRLFFTIFILVVAVFMAACSPLTSEVGPGVNEPTIEVSTAVPATEEPTAEIVELPTPTEEVVQPAPTEEPAPTAEPEIEAPAGFCPDFPRPALVLFIGEDYHLFDPATGELCVLEFDDNVIGGMVAAVGDEFFANSRTTGSEGAATIIQRISSDGSVQELPYTLVDTEHGATLVNFTVSPDASLIAWSVVGSTAVGSDFPSSDLTITNLKTGEHQFAFGNAGDAPRALQPIRFSDDGSMLYYANQPYGIGGSWIAFVGRYDNLYAVPTDGSSSPELIFDCADIGAGLCIGDFILYENIVNGLAYVDRAQNAVIIDNGQGQILNTLVSEEAYIGYPTWSPTGELIYYTADIVESDGPPAPEVGFLHRVAPPIAPAEVLLADPGLLLPVRYLNDTQLIVQWLATDGNWTFALVNSDGTVQTFDLPLGASIIDVSADSTLIGG